MRAAVGDPGLVGVLRRARTPDQLDALEHVLSGPGIGLDIIDETFTEIWTAMTSAVLGEIAAFTAFRHPGLDVCTPARWACRWPRSTWPRRPPRRRPGSAAGARLIAVRDRLAPYLRPGAKVKPAEVPALVEACGGCRRRCRRSPCAADRSRA